MARPEPDEVARAAVTGAELPHAWCGRATTAPVPASRLRALLVLEHREGVGPRTLDDGLASTPPPTGRLCDRVREAGFVERAVSPVDRREVRLHVSSPGHAFPADLRIRRESARRGVVDRMAAVQRTAPVRGPGAFRGARQRGRTTTSGIPASAQPGRPPTSPLPPAVRRRRRRPANGADSAHRDIPILPPARPTSTFLPKGYSCQTATVLP